jgi:hypothetical protein
MLAQKMFRKPQLAQNFSRGQIAAKSLVTGRAKATPDSAAGL